MADFTINSFGGSVPRLAPHLQQQNHAVEALDCRLESGQLSSWREPRKVDSLASNIEGFLETDCCRTPADFCVAWAEGSVSCDRNFATYETGDEEPIWFRHTGNDCTLESGYLGVPRPAQPMTVNSTSSQDPDIAHLDGKLVYRAYAYQFENRWGERGELSHPTPPQAMSEYDQPNLSLPAHGLSSQWGLTKAIIYQSETGLESGAEPGNTDQSAWIEVMEVTLTGGVQSFDVPPLGLFGTSLNALEEDFVPPPPKGLRGITSISGTNTLVGYKGKRLYFCENNRYHSWPHFLTLDHTIRGIVENSGILYVATGGPAYVVTADVDCDSASCRQVRQLPGVFPKISTGNRGMAKVQAGAVYPSHDGLVLLSGFEAPTIVTWPLYTPAEWMAKGPNMARMAEYQGKLFVFMSHGAFVMQSPTSRTTQGWAADFHSELSDRGVKSVLLDRSGQLMLHTDDGLYVWDGGTTLREHSWRSRQFVKRVPTPFGAGHLHFEGAAETITIEVDGRTVLNRNVLSSREFRLPMWATGTRWDVTLRGTGTVNLMTLAETMQEVGS